MINLNDKVIVITGGGGLLGKEFAKRIAISGGIPIIAELDESLGIKTKEMLSAELKYSNIFYHKLDITKKESVIDLVKWLDETFMTK